MLEENIFDNSLYEDDEDDEEYEEYEDGDQHNNNKNRKQGTIVLDYDLDEDERKEIFQNYDLILCEICNRKINDCDYCKDCYEKETDDVEWKRIRCGKCKECFQVLSYYGCVSCAR